MAPKTRVDDKMAEDIIEMTRSGVAPSMIAAELDISSPTVYKVLQQNGIRPARALTSPRGKKLSPEEIDDFVALYYDFVPINELLNKYDITHTQMYNLLNDLGLEPRVKVEEVKEARSGALDHALDLYQNSKMLVRDIIEETGVAQPLLHSELARRNIPLRRPRKSSSSNGDDLPTRYDQ